MELEKSLIILKAASDKSRLFIINALLEEPQYVEKLSQRLNLAKSTVSFHLKKLEAAEIVSKEKQQYYTLYHINEHLFEMPLKMMFDFKNRDKENQVKRLADYRQKILNIFIKDNRLIKLPAQNKKKEIILEFFAALFTPDKHYSEKEVNHYILEFFDDYCLIRRLLIDYQFMTRKNGQYTLTKDFGKSSFPIIKNKGNKMDNKAKRKAIINEYKNKKPSAWGIFQIKNCKTGKIFIDATNRLDTIYNRHKAELKFKTHWNKSLLKDWQEFGEQNFSFEILDQIDPKKVVGTNHTKHLKEHLEIWLEKVKEKDRY
ncbi:MAG: DUF2087 domain-containing protein [Desulfobacteraceae bacterium]|nr:DUF2087 domain-containing protein [Desulfobacteraceae bacterium]